MSQVTYRVIQVSDGQLEGQTDGAAAVSLVAGFPATTQTVTQVEHWSKTTTNLLQSPFNPDVFDTKIDRLQVVYNFKTLFFVFSKVEKSNPKQLSTIRVFGSIL